MQIHKQTHFRALAPHMLTNYQINSILTCQHMEPSYNDLGSLELGQSTYVPRYKTAAGDGKPACTGLSNNVRLETVREKGMGAFMIKYCIYIQYMRMLSKKQV